MKAKLSKISNCRDPQEFNNPLQILKKLLQKQEEKDSTVPPKVKKKVIY